MPRFVTPNQTRFDLVVVGAGPVGLACGIAARRAGRSCLVVEKGCLAHSVYRFPTNMTFFTTPELMEIGDHPLITGPHGKPTRSEALDYYRSVARVEELAVATYEEVVSITGAKGDFRIHTRGRRGERELGARVVILATGYYDCPNFLGIPGEDLPHVAHYFDEAHPYAGDPVLVVGGKNSACEAALDLFRHDADVTLVHRGATFGEGVKYWVEPDIRNRITAGEIEGHFETVVEEIRAESAVLRDKTGRTFEKPFRAVFLLTGYHPDPDFLRRCGLEPHPESLAVELDEETLESRDVRGLFLAGSCSVGHNTGSVFIENGRNDCVKIFEELARRG